MHLRINIFIQIVWIAALVSCSKNPKIGSDQQSSFVKLFGGSVADSGACVVECADGGYAIAGTMVSTNHKTQAFLIRTDQYGNELSWSPKFIGDSSSTRGNHLLLTSDGGFLVTGSAITNTADTNVMVSKISADGSTLWYKTFGGPAADVGNCAIEMDNGNFIIGGYTENYTFGNKDDLVLALTSDGDSVWQKNYGGPQNDMCTQILKFGSDLILLGTTYSYQTTDTIPNIYLIELDPNNPFTPLGGQNYGGMVKTRGMKGVVTQNNQIIIMGNREIADSSKIYMFCLNGSIYNLSWERNIPSDNNEWGYDLLPDNNQLIVLGASGPLPDLNFLAQTFDLSGNMLSGAPVQSKGVQIICSGFISQDNHLVYTGKDVVNGLSKVVLVKTNLPK